MVFVDTLRSVDPTAARGLTIAKGTAYVLFAYEVAYAIDLEQAQRRTVATTARRTTVMQKKRAPAYFEYRPAPLRVSSRGEPLLIGAFRTEAVELVLYDFGAVSVGYAIPLAGPFADVATLSANLWGNDVLFADSRRRVESLLTTLGDAADRARIASFVEDYAIFEIEEFTTPVPAERLWAEEASAVARILRAEPGGLSRQEVDDAIASRLSFGPDDVTFIDSDAALLFDREGDDVRAVIELANTQLLELRYLDQELDDALDRSYGMLARRSWALGPSRYGRGLHKLARLQLDHALLFEQVINALKLIGEQYLTRVYQLVSRRFHLSDWDSAIARKLATLESIYTKASDRQATLRMEMLEWIIIALFVASILLSL